MKNISVFLREVLLGAFLVICPFSSALCGSGSGYITMSITIRDDTCTIESGASTTLDFGKIVMSGLRTDGGEYKRATIKLTCPDTTSRVTATLTGAPDTDTSLFKNAGTATVSARVYKAGTVTKLSNGTSWGLNVLNKAATFEVDVQLLPSKESAQMQAGTIQIPLSITFSYS